MLFFKQLNNSNLNKNKTLIISNLRTFIVFFGIHNNQEDA